MTKDFEKLIVNFAKEFAPSLSDHDILNSLIRRDLNIKGMESHDFIREISRVIGWPIDSAFEYELLDYRWLFRKNTKFIYRDITVSSLIDRIAKIDKARKTFE